ncbi:hypothetical protein HYW35_01125 [Candidatus Saccharibacteria bacterium]|nr:hypothetical protein [Candidatus Saccharibacteria bacterium]
MEKTYRTLRKIIIAFLGLPVLIIGLILIPLPGPGVLVTAGGLFILSLEFKWADRHLQRFKKIINQLIDKSMKKVREKQKSLK